MRILIVCESNTCRSPMFAAALKRRYRELRLNWMEVESAGYEDGSRGRPAEHDWFLLREETGIDLGSHKSRWIGDLELGNFDFILCMDGIAAEEVRKRGVTGVMKVLVVNHRLGGIANPKQSDLDSYRACYRTICETVANVTRQ